MSKLFMWGSTGNDDGPSPFNGARLSDGNFRSFDTKTDADDRFDDNASQADESKYDPDDTRIDSPHFNNDVKIDGLGTKYATAAAKAEKQKKVDDRMWALRKEGYADQDIADKLLEEELGNFNQKSVTSRLTRIHKKSEEEDEKRLDDELSDWHIGEDEMLNDACNEIDKEIDREIRKLQDKKWAKVSAQLAKKMDMKKYTGNACKERFDGLLDGTALKPIELDMDQEGRRIMRETRIAAAKRARVETVEAEKRAEEQDRMQKLRVKMQHMQRKIDRKERTAANRAEREAEKRLREERAEAKREEMRMRERVKLRIQEKHEKKLKAQKFENMIYSYITGGKSLQRSHRPKTKKGVAEAYASDSDDEDPTYLIMQNQDDADADDDEPLISNIKKEKKENKPIRPPRAPAVAKVTQQTLLNPRSIMTMGELDVVLARRGLAMRKVGETHPQVVARIDAADMALKPAEMELLLGANFLPIKGSLAAKAERLAEEDSKYSAAGRNGITSKDLTFKNQYEGYRGKYVRFIDDKESEMAS